MWQKLTLSSLILALVLPANAQLEKILGGLGSPGNQSDSKTASGLKEDLQVGTDHAVDLTGTIDGFFANDAIKILMPEKFCTVEKGLRMAGMGAKVDEFELSMNRAAEKAAPAARGIFKDALNQMTFDDARKILTGGNTAATEYFRSKTSEKLASTFKPTVESAMADTVLKGNKPQVNNTTDYNNGVKVVPSQLLQPVITDRSNYQKVLIDSGYYTADQLK